MQISCSNCKKVYSVNSSKIPPNIKATRCKSCGHKIALMPETIEVAATKKSVAAGQKTEGLLNIACLYCGKNYSINAAKIPPGVKTTKCNACGRAMSLAATPPYAAISKTGSEKTVAHTQPQKNIEVPDHNPNAPVVADAGQRVNPIWQKGRALVAVAAILLLALGGYFVVTQLTDLGEGGSGLSSIFAKKPAAQKQTPGRETKFASGIRITAEPFLAARLNMPLLLVAVDQNTAEDKKNIRYKMTTTLIKSLGLTKEYYFSVLSGVESGGKQNNYRRLPKQRSYTWKKGAFKTTPFLQPPDLVAIPKDRTQPTFFMQFNQVFMKQLNGNKLTYLPEDYYSSGWVEAKFVEG